MLQAHISLEQAYGDDPQQCIDLVVPTANADHSPRLILCLHAGWWLNGSQSELRPGMFALVHGSDIMDDVTKGIAIATEEAALFGAQESASCLLGSGAGGLLAVNSALRNPKAFSAVVVCGATPSLKTWADCPKHIAQALDKFAHHDGDALDPLSSDLSSLPPIHIMHGDSDPEVPASQARELHVQAINAGCESTFSVLTGTQHHFIENPNDRNAQSAYKRIDNWLTTIYDDSHSLSSGEAPFMV